MRNTFYNMLLIATTTVFVGCISINKPPDNSNIDTANKDSVIKMLPLESTEIQLPKLNVAYAQSFKGFINNKIEVEGWIHTYENAIFGELKYTQGSSPIRLAGTIENYRFFRMMEFEQSGNVTGILTGDIHEDGLSGSWFSPLTRKSFDFDFKPLNEKPKLNVPIIDGIEGEYKYQFSNDGSTGNMEVSRNRDATYKLSFNNHTGAPSYNQANLDIANSKIDKTGNLQYSNVGGDYNLDCKLSIQFYEGFAIVTYENDQPKCGFGHNAKVSGVYLKI